MRRATRRGTLGAVVLALATLLAGCGLANPWPTITATPGHHEVLLFGDSLFTGTADWLPSVLAAHGFDVAVHDAHVIGSGPLDLVNGQTPLGALQAQLAAHPAIDTVVFEYVVNCAAACDPVTAGGGGVQLGSADFYDRWRVAAHGLIDYLHADAAVNGHGPYTVLWVISPPLRRDVSDPPAMRQLGNVAQVLSMIDRVELAPAAGGTADWYAALSDTAGAYQQFLYYGGAVHQVRLNDFVHLTWDGAFRTATWTARGLQAAWDG